MRFILCSTAVLIASSSAALARQSGTSHGESPFPGANPAVRAQDDLFRHANGQWLTATEIPRDKSGWGTFAMLNAASEERVKDILVAAAAKPPVDPELRMVGALYASLTDEKAIARNGLGALRGALSSIAKIKDYRDVASELGRLARHGASGPVGSWVMPDERDPERYALKWFQGDLGLPDRDYYLKTDRDDEALREAYRQYLAKLGRLAGLAEALTLASETLALEIALARISWPNDERRDPVKMYNATTLKELESDYGPFSWIAYAEALGISATQGIIIAEKGYFQEFGKLAAKTSISTWKAYMTCRLLDESARYLPAAFRNAHHDFKGVKIDGLKAMRPRWKRAVATMNSSVSDAIAREYVARYFPQTAKAEAKVLIQNIVSAFRARLSKLPWMAPTTQAEALAKLDRLAIKVGYPDVWRGFKGLRLDRRDGVGNLARVSEYLWLRDLADVGRPVERWRWGMGPQIVNAYYDPSLNEIVFPAAILQPPFFDPARDPAFNYGGIGAVIGHEISHGFDDQGRQYDSTGKLRDWWTPADAQAFNVQAERLVAQYGQYEALPGQKVNGKLTLGENIADLAGLLVAFDAYKLTHGSTQRIATTSGGPRESRTGERNFFLGFARNWRSKTRPEMERQRILSDPHSPGEFRTNGVVINVDAFYQTFDLKPTDKLYKQPDARVIVW